jgi:hypothetical protein
VVGRDLVTVVLIIALVAINVGYLILLDRRDKRERAEREGLLQRIQAPAAAVAAHHVAQVGAVVDGDGLPMTDEEIAEQQEAARVVSLIENVENGRLGLLDIGTLE